MKTLFAIVAIATSIMMIWLANRGRGAHMIERLKAWFALAWQQNSRDCLLFEAIIVVPIFIWVLLGFDSWWGSMSWLVVATGGNFLAIFTRDVKLPASTCATTPATPPPATPPAPAAPKSTLPPTFSAAWWKKIGAWSFSMAVAAAILGTTLYCVVEGMKK